MFHWSNNRLSIDLNNGIMRRDGGSSELWMHIIGYGNVTSSLVKLVAMGTQFGGRLNISVSLRLLFRLWVATLLRLLVATLLRLMVATLRAASEVVDVTKLSITAREEFFACVVHLLGKSELLAVQNQSFSVLCQLFLCPNTLILAPNSIC